MANNIIGNPMEMNYVFLLLFTGFLGISVIFDMVSDIVPDLKNHLVEDGAKFLAIVSWFSYISLSAFAQVQKIVRP